MTCQEVCTPRQFAQATGMNEGSVRRMCETGELPYAEKVGSRWFINFDRTMGRAAPVRTQPIDVEELSDRIASKLWQAFAIGFSGMSNTTPFYRR